MLAQRFPRAQRDCLLTMIRGSPDRIITGHRTTWTEAKFIWFIILFWNLACPIILFIATGYTHVYHDKKTCPHLLSKLSMI